MGTANSRLARALRAVAVLGTGIPAGSQLLVATHVAPRIRALPPELAFTVHDELLHHDGHNRVAALPTAVATLAGIGAMVVEGKRDPAAAFTLAGVALAAATGIATVVSAVPANDRIRELRTSGATGDYEAARTQWARAQRVRAMTGPLAFAAMVIAASTG